MIVLRCEQEPARSCGHHQQTHACTHWLMRRMSAGRMTTRFVLTPLMASLIGLVLLRPTVELRAGVGLLMMAAGAGWLLFAPQDNQESETSPLNLNRPSQR